KNTRMILRADVNLLEQVIINLLLNAIEAVKEEEEPYISLSAIETKDHIQLKIQDNGAGMSPEIQEQIFTPFFTTKKTGTGVGLTLSKHIMLMNGCNISVDSLEGEGSTFTLQFKSNLYFCATMRYYFDYIYHFLVSNSRHGTHSPFVYALTEKVIYNPSYK